MNEEKTIALLRETLFFRALDARALQKLAVDFREEAFATGQVITHMGDAGDRLYVIAEGKVEVLVEDDTLVACRDRPDLIGELSLIGDRAKRTATLRASTPVVMLSLEKKHFAALLESLPQLEKRLRETAGEIEIANFLKTASPFQKLGADHLRWLARRMHRRRIDAGDRVLEQGSTGGSAVLLLSGRVEVRSRGDEGVERTLSTLERGSLFGEAALLTDAPRNASVHAIESCELLELQRRHLLQTMGTKNEVASCILQLTQLRQRPTRMADVSLQRIECDGSVSYILKNSKTLTYFKLSEEGQFIWERIDGEHNLKDLTIDYFGRYKRFAPHFIAEILGGLAGSGFVRVESYRVDVESALRRLLPHSPVLMFLQGVFFRRFTLRDVDPFFSRVFRWVSFCLTPWAQLPLVVLGTVGLVSYFDLSPRGSPLTSEGWGGLLVALLGSVVLHEMGHALAVKASGRAVNGVGIGIQGLLPFVFADTSDMWMCPRRRSRVLVSAAGVYVNFLLAGACALATSRMGFSIPHRAAFAFCTVNYALVIFNLSPLLDLDGYHLLEDAFGRVHLRRDVGAWLKRKMKGAGQETSGSALAEVTFVLVALATTTLLALLALHAF